MKSDINGCSTCPVGQEAYEEFTIKSGHKRSKRIQYDYRHTDGELFSCVGKTLEECRAKREKWLWKKVQILALEKSKVS